MGWFSTMDHLCLNYIYSEHPALSICAIRHASSSLLVLLGMWGPGPRSATMSTLSLNTIATTSTVVAVATCLITIINNWALQTHHFNYVELINTSPLRIAIGTHPIHHITQTQPIRYEFFAGGRDRDFRDPKFAAANGASPKNGRSFWCSCQCHSRQLLSNQQGWKNKPKKKPTQRWGGLVRLFEWCFIGERLEWAFQMDGLGLRYSW